MGMSASQVRLLTVTARIHDLENDAQRIQNQKLVLANESDQAYQEYLDALEKKNIQYTNFDPTTGGFSWENMTLNNLFQEGYRLNVKNVVGGWIHGDGNRMIGAPVNNNLLTNSISGPSGLYTPLPDVLTYTATADSYNVSLANGGTLNDIYTTIPLSNGNYGLVNSIQQLSAQELENMSYTRITDTMTAQDISDCISNGKTKFFIASQVAFNNFIEQSNSDQHLTYAGCEIVLAGDFTANRTLDQFCGTFDGNGHTITANLGSNGGSFIGKTASLSSQCEIKNLNFDGAHNSNLIDNIGKGKITNCSIVNAGRTGAIANNVQEGVLVEINNTYIHNDNTATNSDFVIWTGNDPSTCTIKIENSYFIDDEPGNHHGFVVGNGNSGITANIKNSYTTASGLTLGVSSPTIDNSFTTEGNTLTIPVLKASGDPLGDITINLTKNMTVASIESAIASAITTLGHTGSVSGADGTLNIAIRGAYVNDAANAITIHNSNQVLNMLSELGLNNITNTNNSATYPFSGTMSFDIKKNGNIMEHPTINLANFNTVEDVIGAIETELNSSQQIDSARVYMSDNGHLIIDIPNNGEDTYTVESFVESAPGFNTGANPSVINILGLNTTPQHTPVDDVQIRVPRDNQFYMCTSVEEVQGLLGNNINLNSTDLLRELVYNSVAIIMTPTSQVDEDGNTIFEETSVATNTHLREMEDKTAISRAEADYEAALRKIDQKDKKYDKELAAADNQRKALVDELETFKTCIKENVDRTFKLFS